VEFVLGVLPVGELLLDRRTIAALAAAFGLAFPSAIFCFQSSRWARYSL
jgi:hypothetical protein